MTQQKGEPKASEGGIPSNYSRLIARELDLTVSQLPSLLQGTGLGIAQFLGEDSLLTPAHQVRILRMHWRCRASLSSAYGWVSV